MVALDIYRRGLSRHENLQGNIRKISTKLSDELLSYIREPSFSQKEV
jgi:hypothetical protein